MLTSALIYLCAAVLSVPIAKRLGLGSVLGYLLAGVLIGPYALSLVGDQTEVMHFAEFGVVMMLFLIGLELRPNRLWELRRPILGLGGMQVLLTALLVTGSLLFITALHWKTSVAIGLAIALSSTAIVLQSLSERGLLKTQAGNNAFSVLLFQDIAVIPILALLPVLAINGIDVGHGNDAEAHATHSLIADFPIWAQILISITTIVAIIVIGKFLAAPCFRFIAETKISEVFTAFALLIVVAIAVLMQKVGLSPALGTFLAGVVLADNEFRHELEVDIEPFKGLLLGLFFITVGASIDFGLLTSEPIVIIGLVLGLFAIKLAVLAMLASRFKMGKSQGTLFTVALAQGGEFAFVLSGAGSQFGVFDSQTVNTMNLVVALSMLISPLFIVLYEAIFSRAGQSAEKGAEKGRPPETIEATDSVIIAGYGRFGQIIGRLLSAQGYHLTILEHSPSQIDLLRKFGNKVYYGDAARKDLLHASGAEDAKILVIAVDDSDKTMEIIRTAQKHFPHLKILARAIDRQHAYKLLKADITGFKRETFDSALQLGTQALQALGQDKATAARASQLFAEHDHQTLLQLSDIWGDEKRYGAAVRQRSEDLSQVLNYDKQDNKDGTAQDPKEKSGC